MSRYGTRAIFDIAYHSTGLPVQVKDIAERQQIPMKYLEQIFHQLKKEQKNKGSKLLFNISLSSWNQIFNRGRRGIRTPKGFRQRIYSPPRLSNSGVRPIF